MNRIRILADDLTGALDTAAAFSGSVPVFLDAPPAFGDRYFDSFVAVTATPTRDVPPGVLPEYLQPALDWLGAGSMVFKKVDSLLRGNSFAEIAWLYRHGGFEQVVFAPAFPAQGRITVDNRQWIVKPSAPPQAVAEPLREAFGKFGLSSSDRETEGGNLDVWIPEVRTDGDMDAIVSRIGRKTTKKRLWCGSAGLAHAVARFLDMAPDSGAACSLSREPGPTVLVSASFQPVLREQWACLRASMAVEAVAEHANDAEIGSALKQARAGASHAWFDLSPLEEMTPEQAEKQLADRVARLVDGLPRPGQLIVVGGDTLLSLCRTTGADALLASASVRNGWGRARLLGGAWDGVPCYSRSGAFGGTDDLLMMIRLLAGSPTTVKEK